MAREVFAGRRLWILAALAAVLALGIVALVGGCGGGGSDDSSSTSGPVASNQEGKGEDGGGEGGSAKSEGGGGGTGSSAAAGGEGSSGGGSAGGAGETSSGEGGESSGGEAGGGGNGGGKGKGSKGGAAGHGSLNNAASRGGKKKHHRKNRGSTSEEASDEATSISSQEFIAQADGICQGRREDSRQRIPQYTGEGLDSLTKNAPAVVSKVIIPNLEAEKQEIEALSQPSSADEAVGVLFSWIEKMIAFGKEDPQGLLLTSETVFESEEATKKVGFTVCGGI